MLYVRAPGYETTWKSLLTLADDSQSCAIIEEKQNRAKGCKVFSQSIEMLMSCFLLCSSYFLIFVYIFSTWHCIILFPFAKLNVLTIRYRYSVFITAGHVFLITVQMVLWHYLPYFVILQFPSHVHRSQEACGNRILQVLRTAHFHQLILLRYFTQTTVLVGVLYSLAFATAQPVCPKFQKNDYCLKWTEIFFCSFGTPARAFSVFSPLHHGMIARFLFGYYQFVFLLRTSFVADIVPILVYYLRSHPSHYVCKLSLQIRTIVQVGHAPTSYSNATISAHS